MLRYLVFHYHGLLLKRAGLLQNMDVNHGAIGEILPTAVATSSLTQADILVSMGLICGLYTLFLVAEMFLMFKFGRLGPSSLKTGRYHFEQKTASSAQSK